MMGAAEVPPVVAEETATTHPDDAPKSGPWPPRRPRIGPPGPFRRTRRSSIPLFAAGAAESYRSRWLDIQTSFVDEPGGSVEQADLLVAEVMKQLARTFAEKRSKLELKLVKGEDVSTEDLRMALRRYRSFFDRLLTI
jgi:hypothetical protein